jgi:CheY-like chemotaxis protein
VSNTVIDILFFAWTTYNDRMPKKVLIVEDSQLLRKVLRDAMISAGYVVYEAENGRSGLLSAKEMKPDIILLDVLMPVMDGITMYNELRDEQQHRHIHVIMLTSSDDAAIQEWINSEAIDAIKKDDAMVTNVIAKLKHFFHSKAR